MKKPKFPSIISLGVLFISLAFYYSCVDKIELVPKEEQLLGISIQGKLLKGNPSEIRVNIQPIFTFSSTSRKFVKIKSVSLQDTLERDFFLRVNGEIGEYIGFIPSESIEFPIDYFQKYRIQVITTDNNIYLSEFDKLLPVPSIEKLSYELFYKDIKNTVTNRFEPRSHIKFRVTTPLTALENSQKSYLK